MVMILGQRVTPGEIKFNSDYQTNWSAFIPPVRRDKYLIESTDDLSIHGDAPKCFLRMREFLPDRPGRRLVNWTSYIAKVGSKWYPVESITEQLMTRIGQELGVNIADSKLRMVGGQVRFLSKYFLDSRRESLTHGIEIFIRLLDRDMVEEIAKERMERHFYTFQTVLEAVSDSFPNQSVEIMGGIVEMLAFDAIVGNNDRHPANWGVIVPVSNKREPKFSPVYDTARGLFWNNGERKVRATLADMQTLDGYVNRCQPQIGFDGLPKLNHFDLIRAISANYPNLRPHLEKFLSRDRLVQYLKVLPSEFKHLLSPERIILIEKCLLLRHLRFCEAVVSGAEI